MSKVTEQDYRLLLDEAGEQLQHLSAEYKYLKNKFDRLWFYDKDGNFCILDGYQEITDKLEKVSLEIFKLQNKICELKGLLRLTLIEEK